jgi:hypothetical protein
MSSALCQSPRLRLGGGQSRSGDAPFHARFYVLDGVMLVIGSAFDYVVETHSERAN